MFLIEKGLLGKRVSRISREEAEKGVSSGDLKRVNGHFVSRLYNRKDVTAAQPEQEPQVQAVIEIADDGLEGMTVKEIEKLAKDENIDLSDAHLKADKIEAIRAARSGG